MPLNNLPDIYQEASEPFDSIRAGHIAGLRAVEAAVRADQIERLKLDAHFECNCVPELGPPHCHACGEAAGRPVPWAEAVHGPMPDREGHQGCDLRWRPVRSTRPGSRTTTREGGER